MTPGFVIAGAGYTGLRLAPALREQGAVRLIARRPVQLPDSDLYEVVTADLGSAAAATVPVGATIVYLAPPAQEGATDATLDRFLDRLMGTPERIVYASTTGVYGDCDGALVDESRAPSPRTERAIRRLAAEQSLQRYCKRNSTGLLILRVSGIYGPGRLPIERIRAGAPVLRQADAAPGNRIHVDDLVATIVEATLTSDPPGVVNVSDGNHMSSAAFTRLVAREAGLHEPPEITLSEAQRHFTPMRLSFLRESRRIDNTRLIRDLGVQLRYADPAAGVRASLAAGPLPSIPSPVGRGSR